MTTTTVVKFMQKTAESEKFRLQLEALLGVGDGNISNPNDLDAEESAALKGDRAPLVTEFAAKQGYVFSPEELATVIDAVEKYQTGSLSAQDFKGVVGAEVPTNIKPLKQLMKFLSKTYLGY
jgi:hypothetical protein